MGAEPLIRSQARRNLIALQCGEHNHDYAQVLIGWRGRMDCEFSDSAGRLASGTAALVPAAAEHLYAGRSEDSELLVIDVAFADPCIQALEQACGLSLRDTLFARSGFLGLDAGSLPLLEFAARQLRQGPGLDDPLVNYQLVSLFMTQLCQLHGSGAGQVLLPARLDLAALERFVERRLAQPPSNGELAALLNLSESHFNFLFQRQCGLTPQQYVMNLRMRRAQFLLRSSRMSLAAVADEVGFADASSFSRAYKSRFKETPGALRERPGRSPR